MLRNITWTVLSRYIAQGLAVATNILLARYLGVDAFGEYALASSVLLIGNAFTNFGMDMILIRRLASEYDASLLMDGLWLQLFLSIVFITGVAVLRFFVSIPASLMIYSFALLPLSFYSIFTISIRARQQMQIFSVAQVIMASLQFLAVLILWLLHGDVEMLVVLLLASHFLVGAWGFKYYASHITPISFSGSFNLFQNSIRMAGIGTLRLVYEKIPVVLMPALVGYSITGIFSVASRATEAGKLGHLSAFTAIYPQMTKDTNFGRSMKGLTALLGTAVVISTILFFFAELIVQLLFGDPFLSAVPALRILAWSIPPYVFVTYTSLGLVAMGFEKPILISVTLALLILLIFLIRLTPQFGLIGSAAAVLSAEIFHAALLWRQWRFYALS